MRHAPVAKPSAGGASTGTLRYNHVSFSMCYGVLYILAAEAVVFSCLFRKSQLHLKVDFMEGIHDEGMKKTNLSIGSYSLRIISVHFSFARKFTGYTSCAFSKVRWGWWRNNGSHHSPKAVRIKSVRTREIAQVASVADKAGWSTALLSLGHCVVHYSGGHFCLVS